MASWEELLDGLIESKNAAAARRDSISAFWHSIFAFIIANSARKASTTLMGTAPGGIGAGRTGGDGMDENFFSNVSIITLKHSV